MPAKIPRIASLPTVLTASERDLIATDAMGKVDIATSGI